MRIEFFVALATGLIGGLICVLRPEAVRVFAVRHDPEVSERFGGAEAHRRFIAFCGWAMLTLAAGLSLISFAVEG